MALTPILDLPVRWQVMGVDVESLAPSSGFSEASYDVANVNAVLAVENPTEQKVKLVYPFPTEDASAEVRVLSTGKKTEFKKVSAKPDDLIPFLEAIGEISAEQKALLDQIREATKDFSAAEITIPAGTQLLRVHARQRLLPVDGNPRSYRVVLFAPLAGFILAPGGQAQMSVTIAFPPPWAAPGMTIGTPEITPVPGQQAPETQVQGPTPIAERPTYGALWRTDPKVTIPYTYA
jgi:hypothetical protein